MKIFKRLAIVLSSLLPLPALAAYGEPFSGWGFVHNDWQLVCDNTLTCRAAGYAEETSPPASLLFIAAARRPITTAYINYIDESDDVNGLEVDELARAVDKTASGNRQKMPELWLDNKNYGFIKYDANNHSYELTAEQIKQVIRRARKTTKIEIRAGNKKYRISDNGLAAVLLKLDETQGRVGTPLALVSKDSRNRQIPKKALPTPIIHAAYAYPISQYAHLDYEQDETGEDQAIANDSKHVRHISESQNAYWQANMTSWVKPTLDSEDNQCDVFNADYPYYNKDPKWLFLPIDDQHTLAIHPCWIGAYNEGFGYWLVSNDKPSSPVLVTTNGSEYENGEIWASHKDRGLGDCWNTAAWIWDGRRFVMSEASTTGLCRGFAGGAWDLPSYVSEVIKKDAAKNE